MLRGEQKGAKRKTDAEGQRQNDRAEHQHGDAGISDGLL